MQHLRSVISALPTRMRRQLERDRQRLRLRRRSDSRHLAAYLANGQTMYSIGFAGLTASLQSGQSMDVESRHSILPQSCLSW